MPASLTARKTDSGEAVAICSFVAPSESGDLPSIDGRLSAEGRRSRLDFASSHHPGRHVPDDLSTPVRLPAPLEEASL